MKQLCENGVMFLYVVRLFDRGPLKTKVATKDFHRIVELHDLHWSLSGQHLQQNVPLCCF